MSSKKDLSERDICTQFILPALVKSGWDVEKQVREEVFFTDGQIFIKGNKTAGLTWRLSEPRISHSMAM